MLLCHHKTKFGCGAAGMQTTWPGTCLTMKVLLRNTHTGLLYAGPDLWTQDYAEAFSFADMNSALDRVSETHLSGVEVLMHFEDPVYEIPLTIVG